jgi:hypothetical protein
MALGSGMTYRNNNLTIYWIKPFKWMVGGDEKGVMMGDVFYASQHRRYAIPYAEYIYIIPVQYNLVPDIQHRLITGRYRY